MFGVSMKTLNFTLRDGRVTRFLRESLSAQQTNTEQRAQNTGRLTNGQQQGAR